MTRLLFPDFLSDRSEYLRAVSHWEKQWEMVDPVARALYGWRTPWLNTDPEELQDGNPIFTAMSDDLKKAVRIIQAPTGRRGAEFEVWLDTFGGGAKDPDATTELVIVCVLSTQTSANAFQCISDWILAGKTKSIPGPTRESPLIVDESAVYALAA